jgi:flagellar biosynthesis protein FliQ
MNDEQITDFAREAILLTLKISAPIMLIGLVVGLIISLIQALTQIQESTLSFVPKMVAIYAGIFFLFPSMIIALQAFMQQIADAIVAGG